MFVLPGDLFLTRSFHTSDPIGDAGGDAAWVFSVAAIDRLNTPSSLGQSGLGRLTASQLRADEGRPSQDPYPKKVTRYASLALNKVCFVRRSAGFSPPRIYLKSIRRLRTACWIHNVSVSRCRILPKPCREQMPIAALESVQTRRGALILKSSKRASYPRP